MKPAGPLMMEHRVTERLIDLIARRRDALADGADPDPEFIADAAHFLHAYTDRCHHGKEEDILFAALEEKDLSDEHEQIMQRLLDDHVRGRELVNTLEEASTRYTDGDEDATETIMQVYTELAQMYPDHIDTEDNDFFVPAMGYLSEDEQQQMVQEMLEFDSKLIDTLYKERLERYE